jgi:hypothetical protein
MRPAKGILAVDLSPYVDRDGWQTVEACWHVPCGADIAAIDVLSIELGRTQRLDDRVVETLVGEVSGFAVEVRGSCASAVGTLVGALNAGRSAGVA